MSDGMVYPEYSAQGIASEDALYIGSKKDVEFAEEVISGRETLK
jgi:hypothetical protein